MIRKEWYDMSDMGERHGRNRWQVFPEMSNAESWKFVLGKLLPEDHPRVLVLSDSAECFEDMAWGEGCGMVISTRLRDLFERVAPDHAQFIPCTIKYGKRRPRIISEGEHWMVNWLNIVDCFDTARSRYYPSTDRYGDPDYSLCTDLVVDSSRIPPDKEVFRVKGMEITVLVSAKVHSALLAEGITGPQFRPVGSS